jgi:hypothetical protein
MNEFTLFSCVEFTPIYGPESSVGKIATCRIENNKISWKFPPNVVLDCDYTCQVPLSSDQVVQLSFTIGYGCLRDHARYCVINSIGFEPVEKGVRFFIEHQRNHVNVPDLFERYTRE